MDLTDNMLVPLPGLLLPPDLPWRSGFIETVESHLSRVPFPPLYQPPRFFGYYFKDGDPVAIAGGWTVRLDPLPPLVNLPDGLDFMTRGHFGAMTSAEQEPDFLLIHDRHDGACWLWRYRHGLRFVQAQSAEIDADVEDAA